MSARSQLGFVLVLALGARIIYWLLAARHYVPLSDASQYDEIARNLASGHGFSLVFPQLELHPTAWRPPAYPALLGLTYWLFGASVGVGMVLNLLTGLVAVALTHRLVTRMAGPLAGLVAAVLLALYPPLLVNDLCLLTEPLSLVLLLGASVCLLERRTVLAGLCTGVLIVGRPSAQGLIVVIGLWSLWQLGWRRTLRIGAVAALVVVPWVVRNWVQLGSPVLVTSNGFNLAAMYSAQARESGHFVNPLFDRRFVDTRLEQFDEVGWDRLLRDRALQDIRRHPGHLVHVVGKNALTYFELRPGENTEAEWLDGRSPTFRAIGLPLFYVITTAGLVGLWLRRRDPGTILVAAIGSYFAVTSLVAVTAPRLRAPFDLMCCIGVGLLAAWASERSAASRSAAG